MNGHTSNGKFHPHNSEKKSVTSSSINNSSMSNPGSIKTGKLVKIQGHNVKLGSTISVQTGKTNDSIKKVKLVEQHKKAPSKVCVLSNGKKFLVEKSKVKF